MHWNLWADGGSDNASGSIRFLAAVPADGRLVYSKEAGDTIHKVTCAMLSVHSVASPFWQSFMQGCSRPATVEECGPGCWDPELNGDNPLRPPTVPFVPRSDHLLTRGVSNVAESRDLPDVGRCVSTHDVAKLESAYLWGEIMGDKTSPVRRALCASKVYAHVDRARGDLSDYFGVGGHKYVLLHLPPLAGARRGGAGSGTTRAAAGGEGRDRRRVRGREVLSGGVISYTEMC